MITSEEIIKIFCKSLNVKPTRININTKINEIDEWDSLGHLTFLSALDKKTNGKLLKIKNIDKKKTLKEILKAISRK
tara:strand:+ start:395 stop:625 length:231 start_codon:yes stop_codon:yes gene_type:complete